MPKEIDTIILKVEATGEYQIPLGTEHINVTNFYQTNAESPLNAIYDDKELEIVVNAETYKVQTTYINQVIRSVLQKIKFRKLVITNVRFINDDMINFLCDKKGLEIVEFKNLLITRAMINRIKFNDSLKVVIGEDIENYAYAELTNRNIEALTVKKYPFRSDLFNDLELSKSMINQLNSIFINKIYDDEEMLDLEQFLVVNEKLKKVHFGIPNLDINFFNKVLGLLKKTGKTGIELILNDSIDTMNNYIHLEMVFPYLAGNHIKVLLDNGSLEDLTNYKNTQEAIKRYDYLKPLLTNASPLEKILKIYEEIKQDKVNEQINRAYLMTKLLSAYNIKSSVLTNSESNKNCVIIDLHDSKYESKGLFICDMSSSEGIISTNNYAFYTLFMMEPNAFIKHIEVPDDYPTPLFLSKETRVDAKTFLSELSFEKLNRVWSRLNALLGNQDKALVKAHDLNYRDDIEEQLLQIYIKNRTNSLSQKTHLQAVVNLRLLEGKNNAEILEIVKQLVKK